METIPSCNLRMRTVKIEATNVLVTGLSNQKMLCTEMVTFLPRTISPGIFWFDGQEQWLKRQRLNFSGEVSRNCLLSGKMKFSHLLIVSIDVSWDMLWSSRDTDADWVRRASPWRDTIGDAGPPELEDPCFLLVDKRLMNDELCLNNFSRSLQRK